MVAILLIQELVQLINTYVLRVFVEEVPQPMVDLVAQLTNLLPNQPIDPNLPSQQLLNLYPNDFLRERINGLIHCIHQLAENAPINNQLLLEIIDENVLVMFVEPFVAQAVDNAENPQPPAPPPSQASDSPDSSDCVSR